MKAVIQDQAGAPDVLKLGDTPEPVIKDAQVLIQVKAAGINRLDCLQRMGKYPVPEGASEILGLEVAGIRQDTGERVCVLLTGGGYAEYAAADEALCLPVPDHMSFEEAAALPEAIMTVWNNIFTLGRFEKGETVLIHGGSSGIGTTAIQMVKAVGGRVIVTAGTDEKCAACLDLGADLAINYKSDDFVERVLDFTGSKGVNVVLDMIGGDYVPRNIKCMAEYGRHVNIAFMRGASAEIKLPEIMAKRLTLTGSFLRARPLEEKTELKNAIMKTIWPFVEAGKIKPLIYKVFDLEDAAKAHALMESSDHIGKIVLKI